MYRYFAIHKPYGMLSQFIGGHKGLRMLGDLDFDFPEGIHAIGRLDYNSEGLLLLTTNPAITKLLFSSAAPHPRKYLVNVYKAVSDETLERLRSGVSIRIKGGVDYITTTCLVERVQRPDWLPRNVHEMRADIAQDWLEITLTEGKYRQVRKMLQNVLHPCHRLIRLSIDELELGDLAVESVRELSEDLFFRSLKLRPGLLPDHSDSLPEDGIVF